MAANAEKDPLVTADVNAGVLAVMAALGTLAKERTGKGVSYSFASIDDFLSFVRVHCFEAGIFIEQDELEAHMVDVAKGDGKMMAMWWVQYAFTVRHVGGTSIGPMRRSVMVQAFGAQSCGAAMAYALKQFMRSLFLIPTGEADPDEQRTEISASGGAKETDLQRKAGRIRKEFLRAATVEELKAAWQGNAVDLDTIKRASETAHEFLAKEYHTRHTALEETERQKEIAQTAVNNMRAG
jgi:ERF superfamily